MNVVDLKEVSKELVETLQKGGTRLETVKKVVISVTLTDGTEIKKTIEGPSLLQ